MDFLKRILGIGGSGGGSGSSGDANGLYFYVQPNGCDEVIRVRVDKANDLSQDDDGKLFVKKYARGTKCRQGVDLTLYFDGSRKMVNSELSGGTLVNEAAYQAWQASQTTPE
jgi:hypothetical protein